MPENVCRKDEPGGKRGPNIAEVTTTTGVGNNTFKYYIIYNSGEGRTGHLTPVSTKLFV